MIVLIAVFTLVITFVAAMFLIGYFLSGPKYKGPVSDHFDGKKFFTPGGQPAKGLGEVMQWMMKRKRAEWKERKDVPFGEAPPARVGRGARITFVNHSTFLIQADGINFLTDPVWSKRTSPFQWAGPRRRRPPGIRFEDLPKIDVVLLTHNHYDHLDLETMKKVFEKHKPKIITSLGVKVFLDNNKISGATELDWWEEWTLNEALNIQAVPAQHFSGRGMYDRDASLWSGFVIKRPGGNIYFVGDTGYHETMFEEIGQRCAPLEVALVPIGAYKPEWFMSPIHCSPAEAVMIHQALKVKQSIATHFGTFPLADDGRDESMDGLRKALTEKGIPLDQFMILEEGSARDF